MSPQALTRCVPQPVELAAAGPAQQRRWTVLIRWIMPVPHYAVLYFLGIAVEVVAFIGWWGALFTGRLPEFAAGFLSGFLRWSARAQAYALLLTDQYPPVSLGEEPGYPVRIAIPPQDRLSRAAVLFRIILVIPASLLVGLLQSGGMTIVAVIAWLIALITGKLPASLHLAYAAILRYQARVNCYYFMLTAAYPEGLFGDRPSALYGEPGRPPVDFDPADPDDRLTAANPEGLFGDRLAAPHGEPWSPGDLNPADADDRGPADPATPGYEAPGDPATPGDPAAGDLADWRLPLTAGARYLLGWFIGIGAVLWVAYIAMAAIIASHSGSAIQTTNTAIDAVNAANERLAIEHTNYQITVQVCMSAACVEEADSRAAAEFASFASSLHDTPMPANAVAAANALYSDATRMAQDLTQLSHLGPTVTPVQYESAANSIGVMQASNKFQQDDDALAAALSSSG
jgi:hypothetical protein